MTSRIEPEAADLAAWRREVERVVNDPRGPDRLVHESFDRLAIQPLYVRRPEMADLWPGRPPFGRGLPHSWRAAEAGPLIRALVADAAPAAANAAIKEELAGGAQSIHLVIGDPLEGRQGTLIVDLDDLLTVFAGIDLRKVKVAIDAGSRGCALAILLAALAQRRQWQPAELGLAIDLDPLGAAAGGAALDLELCQARAATIAAAWANWGSRGPQLRADGAVYHDAGASSAQELAFIMSTAVDDLRALERQGIEPARGVALIGFRLGIDCDVFTSMAKLRAARRLWHRIAGACGGSGAEMVLDAMASRRLLAGRDIETNMLRQTAICVGAMGGGADAITLHPFDAAGNAPSPEGRRLARTTQLICRHEAEIHRVIDPGGGSFQLETMTANLAREAWSLFQLIEGGGGMAAMLLRGSIQDWIEETATLRRQAVASGQDPILGVSLFADLADRPPAEARPDPALRAQAAARLAQAQAIDSLGIEAQLSLAMSGQPIRHTPAREALTALRPLRLTAAFEQLRDRADRVTEETGQRPSLYIVTLGDPAAAAAEGDAAAALLASGGIALVRDEAEPASRPATWIALLLADEPNREAIQGKAAQLREQGAIEVWGMQAHPALDRSLAGHPDRPALLGEALDLLGVPA